MQVKLTKSNVARIAQALTTYKASHPETQTPMRDMYMMNVQNGMQLDEPEYREQHLRVARYLGWPVRKNGGVTYENGVQIWSTVGR